MRNWPKFTRRAFAYGLVAAPLAKQQSSLASSSRIEEVWPSTIGTALEQDLWTNRDIYDGSHSLMVPMHWVFLRDEYPERRAQFDRFFNRFFDQWQTGQFEVENTQSRGVFFWFFVRYLRLKSERGELSAENITQIGAVAAELVHRFVGYPTSIGSNNPFDSTRDSMIWKLTNPEVPEVDYGYYASIHDSDRMTLSIAADLFALQSVIDMPEEVFEARELGLRVLRERAKWGDDGGWQFQFGIHWDSPEYAYAGHNRPFPGMEPARVEGIGEDTSHHHRLPLLLTSFDPGELQPEVSEEVAAMKNGLAIQMVNHVLVLPDENFAGIRTRNYMDGTNGIYRWEYVTQGEGSGFLPFELSSTFLAGWWSFLNSPDITEAYASMIDLFPLSSHVLELYVGPNTTRERNPLFQSPESHMNGMREIQVLCAALL